MRVKLLHDFCVRLKNASSMGLVSVVFRDHRDLLSLVLFFQNEGLISYYILIGVHIVVYLKMNMSIDLVGSLTLCSRGAHYGFFIPFKKFLYLLQYNPNVLFLYSGSSWDFFFFVKTLEFSSCFLTGLGGYVLSVNSRVVKMPK